MGALAHEAQSFVSPLIPGISGMTSPGWEPFLLSSLRRGGPQMERHPLLSLPHPHPHCRGAEGEAVLSVLVRQRPRGCYFSSSWKWVVFSNKSDSQVKILKIHRCLWEEVS